MKNTIIALILALIIMTPVVSAVIVEQSCIDDDTELDEFDFNLVTNGTTVEYNYNRTVDCDNGCSYTLNQCRPTYFWELVYGGAFTIGLIVLGMVAYHSGRWYSLFINFVLMFVGALTLLRTDVFTGDVVIMIGGATLGVLGLAMIIAIDNFKIRE